MSADLVRSVELLREARIARLRSATGWLSLVGKAFLEPGTTTIGSAEGAGARLPEGAPASVGRLEIAGNVVRFIADDTVTVMLGGERVREKVLVSDRDGRADALLVEGIVLELMERGDTLALRIRDTRVLPRPFAGIDSFPIDPAWAIPARFVPYPETRLVDLDYEGAIGPLAAGFVAPGQLAFEHGGAEHRLEVVYEDASQKRFFVLFRDATSGPESYGLGRFLYTSLPDASGAVTLDYNQAMLPGCAFTVFATCPIPSRDNRLSIAVRAGERNYLGPAVGGG